MRLSGRVIGFLIILFIAFLARPPVVDTSRVGLVNIEEADGSPSGFAYKLVVPNGTLSLSGNVGTTIFGAPVGTSVTLSDNGTFTSTTVGSINRRTFHIDPGGSDRNYNPSGTFNTWTTVKIVNIADGDETITFDSAGIAEAIDQGESGTFEYNGSAWVKTDVSAAPGVYVEDTAYSSVWDGDTSHSPSQNAIYDYLHLLDTNDDGDVDNIDPAVSFPLLKLTALASAPTPAAGRIYYADNDNWDPCNVSGTNNYYCIYDGSSYIALWDEDGNLLIASIEVPTLKASELNDTSDPHLLTEAELKNKILTNSESTGADEWDFPARGEGWNFEFRIEAVQNVTLDPNGTEQWYLNGTQLAEGEAIVNTAPTIGECIVCESTESAVYCESKYADWVEETP